MIPDPTPRLTTEQEVLEQELLQRPEFVQQDQQMLDLQIQTTQALRPLLAHDALDNMFGVEGSSDNKNNLLLSWNQLAEITNCLRVWNLLPSSISTQQVDTIIKHAAHRWFWSLRHPRLAYLAMNPFVQQQVQYMMECIEQQQQQTDNNNNNNKTPLVILWSAHDSTLIGLLCAYALQPPTQGPDYASTFVMELVVEEESKEYFVRFSLNGESLTMAATRPHNTTLDHNNNDHVLIPLSVLTKLSGIDATTTGSSSSMAAASMALQ
jgi:hypothetical protein